MENPPPEVHGSCAEEVGRCKVLWPRTMQGVVPKVESCEALQHGES